jgi:elongation factor G
MAHIDAGKTTTTERILFYTGITHKLGEVHDGTATMDWMVQEQERGITITSRRDDLLLGRPPHQHHRHPGHVDFTAKSSDRSASSTAPSRCSAPWAASSLIRDRWRQADKYRVPRIAFVNKMDRVGADFDRVCRMIGDRSQRGACRRLSLWGPRKTFVGHRRRRHAGARWDGAAWEPFPHRADPGRRSAAARTPTSASSRRPASSTTLLEKIPVGRLDPRRRASRRASQGTCAMAFVPVLCGPRSTTRRADRCSMRRSLPAVAPLDVAAIEGVDPESGRRPRERVRHAPFPRSSSRS